MYVTSVFAYSLIRMRVIVDGTGGVDRELSVLDENLLTVYVHVRMETLTVQLG